MLRFGCSSARVAPVGSRSHEPSFDRDGFCRCPGDRCAGLGANDAIRDAACAVRPAEHTAWTTWCRSWKVGAIRTATWFPVAWDATRRRGATRPQTFCAGSTAKGACRKRTSVSACSLCRRSRQASSGHKFSARLQIHILDRQVPMRIQNFEAALFLFLVGFLVGKELLD